MENIRENLENALSGIELNQADTNTLNRLLGEVNVILKHFDNKIMFNRDEFEVLLNLMARYNQAEGLRYALNAIMENFEKDEVKE